MNKAIEDNTTVTLDEMYYAFNADIDNQLKEINTKIKTFTNSREYVFSKIKPYYDKIDSINYIDHNLINVSSVKDIQPVKKSLFELTRIPKGIDKETTITFLQQLIDLNKLIAFEERKKESIVTKKITIDIYKAIARKFNRKVNKEILNGYIFSPGAGVGSFFINKKKRSFLKPTINWHESNKYKKELIAQGKVPYEIFKRDIEGNILSDNGGEKWFIYYTDDFNLWWAWDKRFCVIKNQALYNFRPVNGEHSLIKELNQRKVNDASYHLKFDR